jgi:hypothetical protein
VRGLVTVFAAAFAFASPATAATIHTVAGNGSLAPLGDGGPATAAGLGPATDIAATPDGGFLLIEGARVRRVGPDGQISTVAGTGKSGFSGDGGAATAARIRPAGIAAEPDGGFLIAECSNNRVRRVSPAGVITTVAGSTKPANSPAFNFGGDGGPATAAKLACPMDVAAQADGGFLIADYENKRVRRVAPDGVISTVAGSAKDDTYHRPSGDGGPATEAEFQPRSIAVEADGSVLIADFFSSPVRRVGTDGIITTVAGNGNEGPVPRTEAPATEVPVTPRAIAATPDGGFLVANLADDSCVGSGPSVLRVSPDGHVIPVAGTGRFVLDPPQGDERAGDGGSALQADLRDIGGVAPAADGGVLVVDSHVACSDAAIPSLVRYVAPEKPALFAANFVDAQKRVFAAGSSAELSVALTLPATVTVAVGAAKSEPQQLPAGTSAVDLPVATRATPTRVTLSAVDAAGVQAEDTFQVFPLNWLTLARASISADKLAFNVPRLRFGFSGESAIIGCRRFGPSRVDCRMTENRKRCDGVISVLLRGGKVWWGEYRCPLKKKPVWRSRPRVMKRRHMSCTDVDTWCDRHPLAFPFGWGSDHVVSYEGIGL